MAAAQKQNTDAAAGPRFVAKERILVGGFVAHNVGDEVPAANVEANGWEELVEPAPAGDGA